jgi:chromosome partitioning protein
MNDLDIRMTAADSAKFLGVSLQFIHKQLKLKKLGSFKSQNRVYFGHSTAKELFNIQFPQKVISFQIVKRGTGKITNSTNIALALAYSNYDVC